MPSIENNLSEIRNRVRDAAIACGRDPESIRLIAVSKKKSAQDMMACMAAGGTHFGENYIQEAMQKIDEIGIDKACWHFIGHLQSNKAKFAVRYFEYIHTVDSVKLAKEINKWAQKTNKIQKVLLQVNIAGEQTKSGAKNEDAVALARQISTFENVSIQGLMCMPPYFTDPEDARDYFKALAGIRSQIQDLQLDNVSLAHLSMGMSNDFEVAIEEGSTMVRVGTSIFGSRY